MTALTITADRAELLRAIDNGKVKTSRRSGETYHDEYAGRRTRVTGKVKVMLLVRLVERVDHDDDRTDVDVRLTDAGRKALAEYDATAGRQP